LLLALAALVVGTSPPRPSLLGEITSTGAMTADVWVPVTEVLPDGSVLVVGPKPTQRLNAERWDPWTGRFTIVDGLPSALSVPGFYGSVQLAGGDVLLVVRRYETRSLPASGGFAVRFDHVVGAFRPVGGIDSAVLPSWVADFAFADWPVTVGPDGTVQWTPPPPELGLSIVTYDPAADVFAVGPSSSRGGVAVTDSTTVIDLGDGRRYLLLEPKAGGGTVATTVDSSGAVESTFTLPVDGYFSQGAPLPDGRVLLVGDATAIVNPDTGAFEALDAPAGLSIRARWLDGRVLLEGLAPGAWPRDARAWVFDPVSEKMSPLSDTLIPSSSTWTVLGDGRVLIVSQDNGGDGPREPIALVLR
jgi:hypothetical protein